MALSIDDIVLLYRTSRRNPKMRCDARTRIGLGRKEGLNEREQISDDPRHCFNTPVFSVNPATVEESSARLPAAPTVGQSRLARPRSTDSRLATMLATPATASRGMCSRFRRQRDTISGRPARTTELLDSPAAGRPEK